MPGEEVLGRPSCWSAATLAGCSVFTQLRDTYVYASQVPPGPCKWALHEVLILGDSHACILSVCMHAQLKDSMVFCSHLVHELCCLSPIQSPALHLFWTIRKLCNVEHCWQKRAFKEFCIRCSQPAALDYKGKHCLHAPMFMQLQHWVAAPYISTCLVLQSLPAQCPRCNPPNLALTDRCVPARWQHSSAAKHQSPGWPPRLGSGSGWHAPSEPQLSGRRRLCAWQR